MVTFAVRKDGITMQEIKFIKNENLKAKPQDETKLGFGKIFTDYMFTMEYNP